MSIRLLIAQKQRLIRQSLRVLLEQERDFTVVAEAADGREAFNLAMMHKPDLALIDFDMPHRDGVMATKQIHGCLPGTKVLLLSRHDDNGQIIEAVEAGAFGYILTDTDSTDLLRCIRAAYRGEHLLSPVMPDHFARKALEAVGHGQHDAMAFLSGLTDREREILAYAAIGHSNKEIAGQLCVSLDTVKTHLHHIYRKLSVHGRVEAVLLLLQAR
jgi:DNA-binding NarL/FixJ family response regulator